MSPTPPCATVPSPSAATHSTTGLDTVLRSGASKFSVQTLPGPLEKHKVVPEDSDGRPPPAASSFVLSRLTARLASLQRGGLLYVATSPEVRCRVFQILRDGGM